jgi:hypothetical protein
VLQAASASASAAAAVLDKNVAASLGAHTPCLCCGAARTTAATTTAATAAAARTAAVSCRGDRRHGSLGWRLPGLVGPGHALLGTLCAHKGCMHANAKCVCVCVCVWSNR